MNNKIIDIKNLYIKIAVGLKYSNKYFVTTNVDDHITIVINASVWGKAFFIKTSPLLLYSITMHSKNKEILY